MRCWVLIVSLFLIYCGGGKGSDDPVSFDQQTEVSDQISQSNNNDSNNNVSSPQSPIEIIIENRFGECVFGECEFE